MPTSNNNKYKLNGKVYNIPDDVVADFEKDNPDATQAYKDESGIYDVPVSERDGFLKAFNKAVLYDENIKDEAQPTQEPANPVEAVRSTSLPSYEPKRDATPKEQTSPVNEAPKETAPANPGRSFWKMAYQSLKGTRYGMNYGIGEAYNDIASLIGIETQKDFGRTIHTFGEFNKEGSESAALLNEFAQKIASIPFKDTASKNKLKKEYKKRLMKYIPGPSEVSPIEIVRNMQINKSLLDGSRDIEKILDNIISAKGDLTGAEIGLHLSKPEKNLGERRQEEAVEAISGFEQPEGFLGKAGALTASLGPYALALGVSVAGAPEVGAAISKGATVGLVGGSMGEAGMRAREAGANDEQVKQTMLATGAIEALVMKFSLGKFTNRLSKQAALSFEGNIMSALKNGQSEAVEGELAKALWQTYQRNKIPTTREFVTNAAKQIVIDAATSGGTRAIGDALQTAVPVIYQNPEDYPTLGQYLESAATGFKNGAIMGAFLGAETQAGKAIRMRSVRAPYVSRNGGVRLVVLTDGKGVSVVEQIGDVDPTTGNIKVAINDNVVEMPAKNVVASTEIPFAEFESARSQWNADSAYEQGYKMLTEGPSAEGPAATPDGGKPTSYIPRTPIQVKLNFESAREAVRKAFGKDFISKEEADALEGEDRTIADNFIEAESAYNGMLDAARDNIDAQIKLAHDEIDANANEQGEIQSGMTNTDTKVYVTGGRIVKDADGSIDYSSSDKSVTIKDAMTGEKSMVDVHTIVSIDDAIPVDVEKASASEIIRNMVAGNAASKIDGELSFENGLQYTILPEEGGEPVQLQIAANEQGIVDNGDGTVNVILPDGQTAISPKAKLQEGFNRYQLFLLEQEKAKRAELENQADQNIQKGQMTFSLGDKLTFDDGSEGEILSEPDGNGRMQINVETPDGDIKIWNLTADEIRARISVPKEAVSVPKTGESVPESAESVPKEPESVSEAQNDETLDFRGNKLPMRTKKLKDGTTKQVVDSDKLAADDPEAWAVWNEAQPVKAVETKRHLQNLLNENADKIKKQQKKIDDLRKKTNQAKISDALDEMQDLVDYGEKVKGTLAQFNQQQEGEATFVGEKRSAAAQEANLQAEQGFPVIQQRFQQGTKVEGLPDEITLANGENISGKYILIEADVVTASHNPSNNFAMSEGFPVDENGKTVNDRDYQKDKNAQMSVLSKANNYDQRAFSPVPPIVSTDGVVLSGNDRTMASQIAAIQGTDTKYTDYINKFGRKYGFTPEQIAQFAHPRIVFVPDEAMEYNAQNFAKFNADYTKSQNKVEKAVKAGKVISREALGKIATEIGNYDDINAVYGSADAVNNLLRIMVDDGFVSKEQLDSMRDGDKLSGTGMDMIESALVGSVLEEDVLRTVMNEPSIRKAIASAIGQVITNGTLEKGYNLKSELADAIAIVKRAKAEGTKTGESIQPFMRELNLFGDDVVAEGTVQLLADILNSKRPSDLKKVLSLYNDRAVYANEGIGDMFSETQAPETKENILTEILNHYGYDTRTFDTSDRATAQRAGESAETPATVGEGGSGQVEKTPSPDAMLQAGSGREQGAATGAVKPKSEIQGLEGYSNDEIIGLATDHIKSAISDGLPIQIVDMQVIGSRKGKIARPDSDLDILVEYSGDYKEDGVFNALNNAESRLVIDGIPVDFNPIRAEESGTIQDWLKSHNNGIPVKESVNVYIDAARAEVNTDPTEGQKKAGNYKMGHIVIDGHNISLENPKGSVRKGVDGNGKEWQTEMKNDYGYIRMTEGVDGDHIDVFLSDTPEQGNVYVVDQVNPKDGSFDEHKVMYGFNSVDEAKAAYLANYEEGWQGLGNITPVSKEEFKKWIDSSHRKTKPFAEYASVKPLQDNSPEIEGIETESTKNVNKSTNNVDSAKFAEPTKDQISALQTFLGMSEAQAMAEHKRTQVLNYLVNEIADEKHIPVVSTLANVISDLKQVTDNPAYIQTVQNEANVNPDGLFGFSLPDGHIFIVSDNIYDKEHARINYIHERQHIMTMQNPEALSLVKESMTKDEMEKALHTLAVIFDADGNITDEENTAYDGENDNLLAKEIISYAMQTAYSVEPDMVEPVLKALGLQNEKVINFVKNIDNEQRKNPIFSNARRSSEQSSYGRWYNSRGNGEVETVKDGRSGEMGVSGPRSAERGKTASERRKASGKPVRKIEDFGEEIAGARKNILRTLAKSLDDVTEESLVAQPLGKAFKRPDLEKLVNEGAITPDDARWAEAIMVALIYKDKPRADKYDKYAARRAERNGVEAPIPSKITNWAKDVKKGVDTLKAFLLSSSEERKQMIEEMLKPDEAILLQERIDRARFTERNGIATGDLFTPNPIWVIEQTLEALGYKPGERIDLPLSQIAASYDGKSYELRNKNGETYRYVDKAASLDEAINGLVQLAKAKRGDNDVQFPMRAFQINGNKPIYENSGEFRVMWITGKINFHSLEFKTEAEADKKIEELNAKGLKPEKSPIQRKTGYEQYEVTFVHPLTGKAMSIRSFDNLPDAKLSIAEDYDANNDKANEMLSDIREADVSKSKKKGNVPWGVNRDSESGTYTLYIPAKMNPTGQDIVLAEGFARYQDAGEHFYAHEDEYKELLDRYKNEVKKAPYFSLDVTPRKGKDYRGGKDVTPEHFSDKFGFRGVQFGNWTNDADRQAALNETYDAFLDLADLLGLSPRSMSLGGELGLAFGARGVGGFLAHYEPSEVVINLTKTRGAGSLAHEWWHALDNYFSRRGNVPYGMVTENMVKDIRPEVSAAYKDLVNAVRRTEYARRSAAVGEYWGRIVEVTARLFAEWVDKELGKSGNLNHFLSRGINLESVEKAKERNYMLFVQRTGSDMPFEEFAKSSKALAGFPYPIAEEVESMSDTVRGVFNSIKEEPGNKGVLFSKKADSSNEDELYLKAVEYGDTETMQRMVNAAAKRAGYDPRSEHRDGHGSPGPDVSREDFTNLDVLRQSVEEDGFDGNLYGIAFGVSSQPDDYFSANGPRLFGYNNESGIESFRAIKKAIDETRKAKAGEIPTIKVYRTMPNKVKPDNEVSDALVEAKLRNGDWVSPSKSYAVMHGEHRFGEGAYHIIEQDVPVTELWWDGNDVREWGWDDGRTYAYKNAPNNIKLLEPITFDKDGRIIPLSERFDENNPEVVFAKANRNLQKVSDAFDSELQQQIDGTLEKGHIYQLGRPGATLRSAGFPNAPIELSASHLKDKSVNKNHPFELDEIKGLVKALQNPVAVFSYGDAEKAQNAIINLQHDGKNFLVGVHFNQNRRGLTVSDIRGLFPKDNHEWLNWIAQGKLLYINKEKIKTLIDKQRINLAEVEYQGLNIQDLIDKQRINLAEVEYLDLNLVTKIIENFKNPTFEPADGIENDDVISFSKRSKPAPKKTEKGYKLMRLEDDGKLYPLFIDSKAEGLELGDWYDADSPKIADLENLPVGLFYKIGEDGNVIESLERKPSKAQVEAVNTGERWIRISEYANGERNYQNVGINGSGAVSTFAMRPGWHLGSQPVMTQIGKGKDRNLRDDKFVWVEVEFPMDRFDEYEQEKMQRSTKDIATHIPEDGAYIKGTSSFVTKDMNWYIAGAIKPVRIIGDVEARSIIDKHNQETGNNLPYDYERESGKVFDAESMKLEDKSENFIRRAKASSLSDVIGKQEFNDYLFDMYRSADEIIREEITQKAKGKGWDFIKGIKDYFKAFAMDHKQSKFLNTMKDALEKRTGVKFPLNDFRYLLWRESARPQDNGAFGVADDVVAKAQLGIDGVTFSKRSSLDERISKDKERLSNDIDAAKSVKNESIGSLPSKLSAIKAAAAQRRYDKETVSAISDLASDLLKDSELNDMGKGEIKRLLAAVKNASGKNDLSDSFNALLDIVLENKLRNNRRLFEGMLKTRGTRIDAKGVEVQAKLDPFGQRVVSLFKEAVNMNPEAIDNMLSEAGQRLSTSTGDSYDRAFEDYSAYMLAKEYVDNIRGSIDEESEIKASLREANEERKNGHLSSRDYMEFMKSCGESINQNRIERIESYENLSRKLASILEGSMDLAQKFAQQKIDRDHYIHTLAYNDLSGTEHREHIRPKTNFVIDSPVTRFLLKPLVTFDQMLRQFGSKSPSGEGYLWNHFMRGWVDAAEKEYLGVRDATKILDDKAAEVFGKKKMLWSDLFSIERKMPTATVEFWDGGKMREHTVTQGNLLYIYMADKMADGRMKLRRMGIGEDKVEAIKEQMDQRFIELADWLQESFYPSLREKYNAVYERMFGAPMATIEDYVPLKILANARVREVDINIPDFDGNTPSTITGSIIKRKRNAIALDILNTDAFDLVLDHINHMEKWAAFAEWNRDINSLLSDKTFRNRLQNMSGIYGSGKAVYDNFRKAAELAAGTYKPSQSNDSIDTAAVNIAKGVTAAKVSLRVYTAIKQLLSMPAFISDARADILAKNLATPWKAWNWCMENLPVFEERWKSRKLGDTRLMDNDADWKLWQYKVVKEASRIGMTPNAFIDAMTVAVGAKSMYETAYKRYVRDGYDEETASKRARQDATILFNETQQSSKGAFVSPMQQDRTWASVALSVYRNSSMGYQRQLIDAVRNLKHMFTPGYKENAIEFVKKQMVDDGLGVEEAKDAAERTVKKAIFHNAARVGIFGFLLQLFWNLGAKLPYLLLGDDDDDKKKILEDAVLQAAIGGSVEGLSGGNIISSFAFDAIKGEQKNSYSLMPLASDISNIYEMSKYDEVAATNEIINLLVQSGFGINPQTLTDFALSIYDACNGDLGTSKEVTMMILKMISAPQTQIRELYLDEIDMKADEALDLNIQQLAKRYAEEQVRRNSTYTGWAYDDEAKKKRLKSYEKRFTKRAEELKRTRGDELSKEWYDYVDNEYTEVDTKFRDLRSKYNQAQEEGDDLSAMEYAEMISQFMETEEFKRYAKLKGSVNAVKGLSKLLKSANTQNRASVEDQITLYKQQLVKELHEEEGNK